MDRGTWWATVPGVSKNETLLKQLSTYIEILEYKSAVIARILQTQR